MFREIGTPCMIRFLLPLSKMSANNHKIWVENIVNRVKMLIYTSNAYRLSPLDKLLPFFISNQAKAKAGIHMQFIDSKIKQRLSIKGSRPDL